jgi:DNA-directed RNA polymerase subunit RPC12/RpoP
MAKCPVCSRDVATPFFLNMQGWSGLVCPHCAARLERKNPRSVALLPLWIGLIALGGQGHRFAVIAEVLMAAIFVVILLEFMRPQLQLRKPPPKPEITLNINGPSN